ncbi:MAG: hypothetical protein KDB61_06180, partial [Planctomycetes bacterium]|nr:hypothetical protein [Planctomycetota bacterium]
MFPPILDSAGPFAILGTWCACVRHAHPAFPWRPAPSSESKFMLSKRNLSVVAGFTILVAG